LVFLLLRSPAEVQRRFIFTEKVMDKELEKLTKMKVHDIVSPENQKDISILRVPGGWIYTIFSGTADHPATATSVFVPFTDEKQAALPAWAPKSTVI
jgi:hypothetical protein